MGYNPADGTSTRMIAINQRKGVLDMVSDDGLRQILANRGYTPEMLAGNHDRKTTIQTILIEEYGFAPVIAFFSGSTG